MNKNYLLYIGVFLAGAIITPLYLSVFNNGAGGDRLEAEEESTTEINLDLTANSDSFTADQDSGKIFVPNDSQEVILNDYPAIESQPVPTGLPEFARNQPPVTPYPNYRTPQIPNFTITQPTPNASVSKAESRLSSSADPFPFTAFKPQTAGSATSGLLQSMPADVFIPPKEIPDPNAVSPPPFGNDFQTLDNFDLESFTGSQGSEDFDLNKFTGSQASEDFDLKSFADSFVKPTQSSEATDIESR